MQNPNMKGKKTKKVPFLKTKNLVTRAVPGISGPRGGAGETRKISLRLSELLISESKTSELEFKRNLRTPARSPLNHRPPGIRGPGDH